MEKLRWGVIGAGGIAYRRTIPGIMLAGNAELIAVMDIDYKNIENIRKKFDAKHCYTDEIDLVNDPEVDAVYIASPVVLHAKHAKIAANAGKHILLEKPLAMTSEEAQLIVDYCSERRVKIAAGFMMRFGSHVLNMKKAISDGKIGNVVSGYAQFTLWLPREEGNWRQIKAKSGGGSLMDLGVHCIDLIEFISGERITHVAALNETITFDYDVEDTSTVLLRLSNGAQCVVATNFNIPDEAAKWRLEFFGTKGRLQGDKIIGQNDEGSVNAVFINETKRYDCTQNHMEYNGIFLEGKFGNMYTREIESFSDSVLYEKELVVPGTDAVHIQRVIEAAYQSTVLQQIIKV